MEKDFTDYVALILEAEKRVYHIYHFRSKKNDPEPPDTITHNDREYVFDRDRAFQIRKWAPWKKVDGKHPFRSMNELMRSKRVGLLLYHETIKKEPLIRYIKHKKAREYICKECGFTTVHLRGMKTHMKTRHKLAEFNDKIRIGFDITTEEVKYYPAIQPIHISRVHQPSGEIRDA